MIMLSTRLTLNLTLAREYECASPSCALPCSSSASGAASRGAHTRIERSTWMLTRHNVSLCSKYLQSPCRVAPSVCNAQPAAYGSWSAPSSDVLARRNALMMGDAMAAALLGSTQRS